MYTLKVTLKQHTPLIHFQHDQEGATLRASEVKPKLDKYILNKLTPEEKEQGKRDGWIKSKYDKVWLDYKMRIEATGCDIWEMKKDTGMVNNRTNKPIINTMPLYFGNINSDNPKNISFCSGEVIVYITTRFDDLKKIIDTNKISFFILHNFGTRQSKGFGSFMPEVSSVSRYMDYDYAKFEWSLPNNINFGSWDCFYEFFTAIDFFYKTIRSGINQNEVYIKSLMYFYALDREEYWDKRTIRYEFQHFTPNKHTDKGEMSDMAEDGNNRKEIARLYRDMLGLSSPQTWKSYDDVITKEHVSERTEDEIERFRSPILIKPIFNNGSFDVYLIPLSIPALYKDADFRISSKARRSSFIMKTPSEFDVCDFLRFITDEGIVESMRETLNKIIRQAEQNRKNKTKKIARTILSIFNNIRYVEN